MNALHIQYLSQFLSLSVCVCQQVIRTKDENKARGFGFVSFLDPMDCAKAIREMNGKYLASRYDNVPLMLFHYMQSAFVSAR